MSQPLPLCQSDGTPLSPLGSAVKATRFQEINDIITVSPPPPLPATPAAARKQQRRFGEPGAPQCHVGWHRPEQHVVHCIARIALCNHCSLYVSAGTDANGRLHLCSLIQSPSTSPWAFCWYSLFDIIIYSLLLQVSAAVCHHSVSTSIDY